MLGMKMSYIEVGSGVLKKKKKKVIQDVRRAIQIPLIVGGGITNTKQVLEVFNAGADIIVIGNAIEKNPEFLTEAAKIACNY